MKRILLLVILSCCVLITGCNKMEEKKLAVDYVNQERAVERIIFEDGYVYPSTDSSANPLQKTHCFNKGLVHGTVDIGANKWVKVTTDLGNTGWYLIPTHKNPYSLGSEVGTYTYRENFPQVSGGHQEVRNNINQAIREYVEVFQELSRPVGNNLYAQITYHSKDYLSILFETNSIYYRGFSSNEYQDTKKWGLWNKYAYMNYDLPQQEQASVAYVPEIDLQYGMVFDLTTGQRIAWNKLIKQENIKYDNPLKSLIMKQNQVEKANFYLNRQGDVITLVENPVTTRRVRIKLGRIDIG